MFCLLAIALQLGALHDDTPPAYDGYTLVWHDEFNGDHAPPDPEDWVYEEGFVRNQEAQWYQRANVVCRDGHLVIEARRERVENPNHDPKAGTDRNDWKKARTHAEYTSGSIKTRGKHEWLYGRWEMRGRIDIRDGLWPAWWTVGTARPWPACGEIDMMEFYRGTLLANAAWGSAKQWAGVWDASNTPIDRIAKDAGMPDAATWAKEFHVWRMDWDESAIRLFVDGKLLNEIDLAKTVNQSADGANPFHEPHHMILNLAVGGTSGGDPSKTAFPATFEVDWVRVYQKSK